MKKGLYYFIEDDAMGQRGVFIDEVRLTKEEYLRAKSTRSLNGRRGFLTKDYLAACYYIND